MISSGGKVHADTTVAAGGVVGPALYYLGHVPQAAIVSFTGVCMVGLVINPDLYMRHRHLLSHFPLVGTAGRVLYLLAALALLWFAAGLLPLPLCRCLPFPGLHQTAPCGGAFPAWRWWMQFNGWWFQGKRI